MTGDKNFNNFQYVKNKGIKI
ncbi:ATP-dependent Zn protease, partial ['Chrysanthemum coronarium' phytoplasma]